MNSSFMKVLLQSFFILQTLQVQFHGITGGIVPTPPPYMASSRKHASLSQSEQSIKRITMFNACKTLDVRNTPCLVSFSKKSTHLNWPPPSLQPVLFVLKFIWCLGLTFPTKA